MLLHTRPPSAQPEGVGATKRHVLDALVRAIEVAALETLCEAELPPVLQPQAFVLR